MTGGPSRVGIVVGGGLAQLAIWLVLRPDLAGPQWHEGSSLEVWLALEAVVALAIGVLAANRTLVVWTVLVGWVLQMAHFAVLGEHYDSPLAGMGVLVQAVLAAGALAVALLARRLSGQDRRRLRA